MAFGAGSIVTPKQTNALLFPAGFSDQPQPPLFGVVCAFDAMAGTATVLWNNGTLVAGIDINCLFEIVPATSDLGANQLPIPGRIVRVQPDSGAVFTWSPEYDAMVVLVFQKQLTVAPFTALGNMALIKTITNGIYFELPTSVLIVVEGR